MGRKDIVYTEGVERFTRNELIIESVIRVILVGGWLYWGLAKPFIREATVMDWHQHHYSLEVQTISGWMLYGICSCAAIGTTIFWALVWGTKRRPMIVVLTETGRYAFGLSMSWFVTAFFTHFVKYEYGALRPDFLNRCFPSIFADLDLNLLQRIPICEDPENAIAGRQSFPSSHSGFLFSVFGYIAIHIVKELGDWHAASLQLFVPIALMVFPLYTCVTQVREHRYFPRDIIAGAILGWSCAASSYFYYYVWRDRVRRAHLDRKTRRKVEREERRALAAAELSA
eukprot:Polyplicarium_translucidae@DN2304_c0_g1_i2.p2